jgi:hypothetical protein
MRNNASTRAGPEPNTPRHRPRRNSDCPARPADVVGAALEASSFHPGRSGRNHLRVYCAVNGFADIRADQVLALVGLTDAARRGSPARVTRCWCPARPCRRYRPPMVNLVAYPRERAFGTPLLVLLGKESGNSGLQAPECADRHGAQLGTERESVLACVQDHAGDEVVAESILEMP